MQKNHNEPEMPSSVFVALVGRPNVGINASTSVEPKLSKVDVSLTGISDLKSRLRWNNAI